MWLYSFKASQVNNFEIFMVIRRHLLILKNILRQKPKFFCVAIFSQAVVETFLMSNCSIFSNLCGQQTVFFSGGEFQFEISPHGKQ